MTASTASPDAIDAALPEPDPRGILEALQLLLIEVTSGRMIERLMAIVVERTCADRGLLVLRRQGKLVLEAITVPADAGLSVQRIGRPLLSTEFPASMLVDVGET